MLVLLAVYIIASSLCEIIFNLGIISNRRLYRLWKYGEPTVVNRVYFMNEVLLAHADDTFYYDQNKTNISRRHTIHLEDLDKWSFDTILRFIATPISTTLIKLCVKKYKMVCYPVKEMASL